MIKLPFSRSTFSREMKPKISGNNLSLEFDNIESTLSRVAVEISSDISDELYNSIIDKTSSTDPDLDAQACDYLQRAMLHFAIFQHKIYLIANIANDGITVKKSNDNTTIFKYQEDELSNKLISDAWFWFNQLLKLLNKESAKFPKWDASSQKKDYDSLPVKIDDFKKWVGVSSEYFMVSAKWIIREVWNECVLSRVSLSDISSLKIDDEIKRAVCYEVLGRACKILAYYCLPEPIRLDINNEMSKDHNSQSDTYIREKVATSFLSSATSFWSSIDSAIQKNAELILSSNVSNEMYQPKKISQRDSFAY